MVKKIGLFSIILFAQKNALTFEDSDAFLKNKKEDMSLLKKVINELIKQKKDLNQVYQFGPYINIPLKQAIEYQDEESVDLLLKNRANVNIKVNYYGSTLLHIAAYGGDIKIIELLIKAKININARERKFGNTALITAFISNNSCEVIEFLLKHGADPNIKDIDGNTALIIAIKQCNYNDEILNYTKIIRTLIFHGADMTICDSDGKNFIELTENEEFKENLHKIVEEYQTYTQKLDILYV